MKKLVIILAIAIMLSVTQEQRTEQPATVAVGASPTGSPEELPETHTEQVEQITEATSEPVPTEATEEETAVQKTPVKECTEEAENSNVAESEETVQCVDMGDQSLAEYKSQPS